MRIFETQDVENFVMEFFVKFSRLEYALKRGGYLQNNRNSRVKVDWNRFADSIADDFQSLLENPVHAGLKQAVDFVRQNPPRKLVSQSQGSIEPLCWKVSPASQGSMLRDLLVYVRRIRNNLFHGEKPRTVVGGSERGEALIQHGITIVDACFDLDEEIRDLAREFHHTPRCN